MVKVNKVKSNKKVEAPKVETPKVEMPKAKRTKQPAPAKYMTPDAIRARIEYLLGEIKKKEDERAKFTYHSKDYMVVSTRIYAIRKSIKRWQLLLNKMEKAQVRGRAEAS